MKEHYYNNYDTFKKWIFDYYQIEETVKLNPDSVLIIGKGNGFVSEYMVKKGYNITSLDIDPELKPDIVADVTTLSDHVTTYDTILCCQVLEYLPFASFDVTLHELYKCCNNLILSLPDNSFNVSFNPVIRLPRKISKFRMLEREVSFTIPVPEFMMETHQWDGQHHWEIGKKGYPLYFIKSIINKYFDIKKEYFIPQQPYHRFFVLNVP